MSYDQKCYDLAWEFLSDIQEPVKPADADRLAQEIQQTIEDYLEEVEERAKEPPQTEPHIDTDGPPALKLEMERDLKGAVAMGKVWGEVFDNLFAPKR